MSYSSGFEDFFSTFASSQPQNLSPIPKFELPQPVVIIDEPIKKTSSNKKYSNTSDQAFIVAPFMEHIEKDLEEESENEDEDTYQDALDYLSDIDHDEEDNDSDSTLPVDIYKSPDKYFTGFFEDAKADPILSRNESHSSNLTDITITSSVPNEECSKWSVHTVYTWKDSLFLNESRSSFDLPEETEPCKRLRKGSTVSTRSSLRDIGPDTRSREEIFSKGVPWGFHGRDYMPPLLKRHKLRETMRGMSVERNRRFLIKVKRVFRRGKE